MTTPTNPYLPGGPVEPAPVWPPQVTPPAKRRNRLWLILAAVVALLVVIGGTVAFTLAATGRDNPTATPTGQYAADEPSIEGETLPDPTPTTAGPALLASDVKLSTKVIDKQCFGSAGCMLSVQIVAKHADGPGSFKSEDTWLVTYELSGVNDGPLIGSFEISGGTYEVKTEDVETKTSKSKLTLKVTDVEKVGI